MFFTPAFTVGMANVLGDTVLDQFDSCKHQISICETILPFIAILNLANYIRSCDVLWFLHMDKTCALGAHVKGSSSTRNIARVTALVQLLPCSLDARVFWEFVESDANASGGLSRNGILDGWTLRNYGICVLLSFQNLTKSSRCHCEQQLRTS